MFDDLVRAGSSWFGRSGAGRVAGGASTRRRIGLAACLLAALASASGRAWGQTAPVEIVEIARGGRLGAPNFFALTVDPQGNIYVGGANSNNVLRMAPRGDAAGTDASDGPCVTEILSTAKAQESGVVFAAPKGIALASDGSAYVVGTGGAPNVNDNVVRVSPAGTITELVDRADLGRTDWNPAGIALDESGGTGVFVYATGPAPAIGIVVRIAPDLTVQQVLDVGGQGLAMDGTGALYLAQVGEDRVVRIPEARSGVCGEAGKQCAAVIEDDEVGCDGQPVHLDGPYALAIAGGILYVTGQNSKNVVRRPLRADNALGLPLCSEAIFTNGDAGLVLDTPRAIAADDAGNVYAAGNRSDNVIWIRPDPMAGTQVIAQELLNRSQGLVAPQAAAVDRHGNVYVSGATSHNVFRIRTVTAGAACGNGVLDAGEACDYRVSCCCSTSCELQAGGAVCRDAAGDCDADDVCDGMRPACFDDRQEDGAVCRPSAGDCDIQETCDGGVACPSERFLPAGTVCRVATSSCDRLEQCDGLSATCPEDAGQPVGAECNLTPQDIGEAEIACVRDTGACSETRACLPRPRIGAFCVPADLLERDLGCVKAANCTASGRCDVQPRGNGEQCGSFCDYTECREARCVAKADPHPCGGGDDEHCDPKQVGSECTLCGNRQVEPFEQCDDGNEDPVRNDGCTARCRFACDPNDPTSCAQPFVADGVPDPCRHTECRPVDLDPHLDSEGFACVTEGLGCTGCLTESDCYVSDACVVARCVENRCDDVSKRGMALAACAFADVFPGEGTDCAMTEQESTRKNRPRTLRQIEKWEVAAKGALEQELCPAGGGKPNGGARRRARDLLRRAVFQANVLRTPFRARITQECENLLTRRFERMLDNLKNAAHGPGWSCPADQGGLPQTSL